MDQKKFIAGGLSGIIEASLTHPLDYMKIKSQEYNQLNDYECVNEHQLQPPLLLVV